MPNGEAPCTNGGYINTVITEQKLLGYTPDKLAALMNLNNCAACHTDKSMSSLAHPTGAGTPSACTTCHTTQHQSALDVNVACGQCHGGSAGPGAVVGNAPYISNANIAQYAQAMHGGAATSGPVSPDPVTTGCATLTADGSLSATAGTTATIFALTDSTIATPHDLYMNWGDGTPLSSGLTHSYVHEGHFQVVQTVKDDCGYKSQKVYTVNISGGDNGKGNLTITSSGAAFNYTYQVYATGNSAAITNGKLDVGATKTIILDGSSTYTVKLLLPSSKSTTQGTCSVSGQACLKNSDCPLDVASGLPETCTGLDSAQRTCTWTTDDAGATCTTAGAVTTCEPQTVPVGGSITITGGSCL